MTQEQILKKAIEKAIKNGYDIKDRDYNNATGCESMGYLDTIQMSRVLCFSHDFAKAFFGEGMQIDYTKPCPHCKGKLEIANPTGSCYHVHYPEGCDICSAYYIDWEDCLQEMVLEKDPISYLERFI